MDAYSPCLAEKSCLTFSQGQGVFPARYSSADVTYKGKSEILDPNHTHFLLIDTGSTEEFSAEMVWRIKFEEYLCNSIFPSTATDPLDNSGGFGVYELFSVDCNFKINRQKSST